MEVDISVLRSLEREQDIPFEELAQIIEQAVQSAYLRHTGRPESERRLVTSSLDRKSGEIKILVAELDENGDPGEALPDNPEGFSRVAGVAAKQIINQRMRSLSEDAVFVKYRKAVGQVLSGQVRQSGPGPLVKIDLGDVEAVMRPEEQTPGEEYLHGQRLRVYVLEVAQGLRGAQIYVSRTHPGLIRGLFAHEVPEIESQEVEIMAVAREPGHRTKIAVKADDPHLNPVGTCIGEYGRRVRAVTAELGEEKIDIINYDADLGRYVANALSPASVTGAFVINPRDKAVRVYVPALEYSLAIGRDGQNARLAARLTGARVDIRADSPSENVGENDSDGRRD